jgi:NADH dehydrogenase
MNNPVYQTVIVGGGFTGLFAALHLAHQHYPRSVILIDPHKRFCFKPLLYEYFSAQMDALQVVPPYEELLRDSGVIFVRDSVQSIDLQNREVKLTLGTSYNYSNLVLAVGSVTGYFGVEGAKEYALPLWSQANAIAIDRHIRDCLQRATQTQDPEQRRTLLTVVVVGGGPSGVEMAATLADLLPHWYAALGGEKEEIRVVLINHGEEILEGDINSHLRHIAEEQLQNRAVKVEMLMGAEATAVRPNAVEYKRDGKTETLSTATTVWTAGTSVHPLIKDLPIPKEHRDRHGRPFVTPTLQLLDFPEVFAGGDCAAVQDNSLPPTAQVAYQQGAAIARNLKALALGHELEPARVNIRGTLLKLGLEDAAANIYDLFELDGEVGHLIRQATYLELLPTPIHDFKATTEWLREEVFRQHLGSDVIGKTTVRAMQIAGGVTLGILATRKLLQILGDEDKSDRV